MYINDTAALTSIDHMRRAHTNASTHSEQPFLAIVGHMGAALLPSLVALDLVVAAGPPAGDLAAAVCLLAAGLFAAGLLAA